MTALPKTLGGFPIALRVKLQLLPKRLRPAQLAGFLHYHSPPLHCILSTRFTALIECQMPNALGFALTVPYTGTISPPGGLPPIIHFPELPAQMLAPQIPSSFWPKCSPTHCSPAKSFYTPLPCFNFSEDLQSPEGNLLVHIFWSPSSLEC